MSITVYVVFIFVFEQVFVCKENTYLYVSQSLQLMEVHITDRLLFVWMRRNGN